MLDARWALTGDRARGFRKHIVSWLQPFIDEVRVIGCSMLRCEFASWKAFVLLTCRAPDHLLGSGKQTKLRAGLQCRATCRPSIMLLCSWGSARPMAQTTMFWEAPGAAHVCDQLKAHFENAVAAAATGTFKAKFEPKAKAMVQQQQQVSSTVPTQQATLQETRQPGLQQYDAKEQLVLQQSATAFCELQCRHQGPQPPQGVMQLQQQMGMAQQHPSIQSQQQLPSAQHHGMRGHQMSQQPSLLSSGSTCVQTPSCTPPHVQQMQRPALMQQQMPQPGLFQQQSCRPRPEVSPWPW